MTNLSPKNSEIRRLLHKGVTFLFSFLLAAGIFGICTACAEDNSVSGPSVPADEASLANYKAVYADLIAGAGKDGELDCELYYIDGDEIPELGLVAGDFRNEYFTLYKMVNGEAVCAYESYVSRYGTMRFYIPYQNRVLGHSGPSDEGIEYTFYCLSSEGLLIESEEPGFKDTSDGIYYSDGTFLTREEFAAVFSYDDYTEIYPGRTPEEVLAELS